jgi:hypothetical protein
MGDRSIAPEIKVPTVGFLREIMLAHPRRQEIQVVNSLTAADDLAVALRRQQVRAFYYLGPIRIRLHIEGLYLCWITGYKYRLVVFRRNRSLVGRPEIVSPLEFLTLPVQQFHGLIIRKPREWRHNTLQFRKVSFERDQLLPAFGKATLYDV